MGAPPLTIRVVTNYNPETGKFEGRGTCRYSTALAWVLFLLIVTYRPELTLWLPRVLGMLYGKPLQLRKI